MKKIKFHSFILALTALPLLCSFGSNDPFLLKPPSHIEVNNRVLSNVNGKPVTVYDVMKKMDILFYRQFPQYANSLEARFQFYQMSWKNMFKEIIEKDLILNDGKEIGITLSAGDIRQEMQSLFGPNIIANLDKLGMSYQEAEGLLREELIIRKTIAARVQSRILRLISPQDIKKAYEGFLKTFEAHPSYLYHIITIRDKDPIRSKETADLIRSSDLAEGFDKEKIEKAFIQKGLQDSFKTVTLSSQLKLSDKEISEEQKKVLDLLKPKELSLPKLQKNKKNEEVLRLFYLVEKESSNPPPFNEMENKLKEKIFVELQEKETIAYLQKLYQSQHINMQDLEDSLPSDFKPFTLK